MNKNKKRKSKIILSVFLSIIFIYFSICGFLYFFEPVSYKSTNLQNADYSFEMYDKFSYEYNNEFYIKNLEYTDIVTANDDIRLKYVDNTILAIASDDADYTELTSLFESLNAEICGYIEVIDLYQLNIPDKTYSELANICSILNSNQLIEYSHIDIFEETPSAEETSEDFSDNTHYNSYYYDMLGINQLHDTVDKSIFSDIRAGVFDIPVYYSHSQLNIVNKTQYNDAILSSGILLDSASHGTHIAGIISASEHNNVKGVLPGAQIYSENATNNSLSYWIASIVNMIVNEDIKAINISMGFNSYITVSASLGDQNSISYIIEENNFMEAVLRNLLNEGFDFVLCIAAGNEANTKLYKVNSPVFGYGNKEKLNKIDFFNIFSAQQDFADAIYGLCFNAITAKEIQDRIIVVTSCDEYKNISSYASLGDRVDIAAPGDHIYSTGCNLDYEYMSGTSMATPFVTATAALLFELDESLTGADVKNIIISSSAEIISGSDFNYPLLNIYNAVETVLKGK